MDKLVALLQQINKFVWGWPSLILIVGTGLYLTLQLRGFQFRNLLSGFKLLFSRDPNLSDKKKGDISGFQALATALSGTVGTGNIAGVATAITLGGAGAVFWMWVTALVGMITKFASCTLAVHYREFDQKGEAHGGPMYTLKNGLNQPVLGGCFAAFALMASFGIGNTVQANSIVSGLGYAVPALQHEGLLIGFILAALVGSVLLGGVKRIARVAGFLVPFMVLFYCAAAVIIILFHLPLIPHIINDIITQAFSPSAAAGGTLGQVIRYGVARGVFSNESGLGSAAIAHASAQTSTPVRQGLIAMTGPFIDTLVVCSMTALVILIAQSHSPNHLQSAALSAFAFETGLNDVHSGFYTLGAWVVSLSLITFAFTSLIAWAFYGDRCAYYLLGNKASYPYRIIFTLLVIFGAAAPLHLIWEFADLANILMAIPNLIAVVLLTKQLKKLIANEPPR